MVVLATLHQTKNIPERVAKYSYYSTKLNSNGIFLLFNWLMISGFKYKSPILGYEKKAFFHMHVRKRRYDRNVDLPMKCHLDVKRMLSILYM